MGTTFRVPWPLRIRCLGPLLAVMLLGGVPVGRAGDFPVLQGLSPETRACLEAEVGTELASEAAAGHIPQDRKARKRLKEAYAACEAGSRQERGYYAGPFFDAMCQIDETFDLYEAVRLVREARVDRLALFARSRKELHQNERAVLDLARANPDLIVLGAPKYFQLSGDLDEAYIRATLEGISEHGYRFVGEILYTHADKGSGKQHDVGERYVDPSRSGTARLLQGLAGLRASLGAERMGEWGVPLMVHFEPYEVRRDFDRFHTLFEAWPRQAFIVPHMAFASPGQVASFLDRHPNVFMTTSKKVKVMGDFTDPAKLAATGPPFLDNGALRPEWRDVLVRHQDRILAATDAHMAKLWGSYPEGVDGQRKVLGQLPREVAEKIAYRNAVKLYGVNVP